MTAAKDDLSRVNIEEERSVRYWTETLDCSKDELAAAVAKVGESPHAVRREVNRARAYGAFPPGAEAPSRQRRAPGRLRKHA
jgi:hypothetical protein